MKAEQTAVLASQLPINQWAAVSCRSEPAGCESSWPAPPSSPSWVGEGVLACWHWRCWVVEGAGRVALGGLAGRAAARWCTGRCRRPAGREPRRRAGGTRTCSPAAGGGGTHAWVTRQPRRQPGNAERAAGCTPCKTDAGMHDLLRGRAVLSVALSCLSVSPSVMSVWPPLTTHRAVGVGGRRVLHQVEGLVDVHSGLAGAAGRRRE